MGRPLVARGDRRPARMGDKADKSRQHVDGTGHGLGLAIAQQLVRAHRGEINVVSEVGVGTKFTLEFPLTILLA